MSETERLRKEVARGIQRIAEMEAEIKAQGVAWRTHADVLVLQEQLKQAAGERDELRAMLRLLVGTVGNPMSYEDWVSSLRGRLAAPLDVPDSRET